jgi:phosphatidylglycerol:prolipoprotein diacylglycerol transferase
MALSAAAFILAGIYEKHQQPKPGLSPIIAATSRKKKDSGTE